MYKRFWIVAVIIIVGFGGLCLLGLYSLKWHEQGVRYRRNSEYIAVAEQIRRDVKGKLDEFIQAEQDRPVEHYRKYYEAENGIIAGQFEDRLAAVVRSPISERLDYGLAYGYFEIGAGEKLELPYQEEKAQKKLKGVDEVTKLYTNVESNLLPVLRGEGGGRLSFDVRRTAASNTAVIDEDMSYYFDRYDSDRDVSLARSSRMNQKEQIATEQVQYDETGQQYNEEVQIQKSQQQVLVKNEISQRGEFEIQSLLEEPKQQEKVVQKLSRRSKRSYRGNEVEGKAVEEIEELQAKKESVGGMGGVMPETFHLRKQEADINKPMETDKLGIADVKPDSDFDFGIDAEKEIFNLRDMKDDLEVVEVRIEPFVPVMVDKGGEDEYFEGQVFMLRHIKYGDEHLLQGFQLNTKQLREEVVESTERLTSGRGMKYELSRDERNDAAYSAVLDFGFGELVLNMFEIDEGWLGRQSRWMKRWYVGIIAVVFVVVFAGLLSLWRNVWAQLKLARKKDAFISAVSHELRTPLTSIRMYIEMLEKNWVRDDNKRGKYYRNIRQESERLSRLIENVLDFSRIQRQVKKYNMKLGNVNECIDSVVEMMRGYAGQKGFELKAQLGEVGEIKFDNDAVMQIVINLVDNAVKYAGGGADNVIIVRSKLEGRYVVIEVEDHGPGVERSQRDKIFDQFYRVGDESTRETAGTGLGLALVKSFAVAHNGFVEILNAKPKGAVFKVALSA